MKCASRLRSDRAGRRVRCIAKVADAYKVDREVAPVFRPDAAQPYDDRIIRFVKDGSAVSLWTLEGRMVIPIVMGEHQRRLMAYRKGEVDLCFVRGKWMLAAIATFPRPTSSKPRIWLGVDLGIVALAADSDGTTTAAPRSSGSAVASRSAGTACRSAARRPPSGGCANWPANKRGSRNTPTTASPRLSCWMLNAPGAGSPLKTSRASADG